MKRRMLVFIVLLVALTIVGIFVWQVLKSGKRTPPKMEVPVLVLTKAWNGEVVRVPGPLTVPQWIKDGKECRGILRSGNALEITWTDQDGNNYEASALGKAKNAEGKLYVDFSYMKKQRPNGSYENVTVLTGDSKPVEWKIRDESGNLTMHISKMGDGSYLVNFYDIGDDRCVKEWEVDPSLSIYSEQVRGEDGHWRFTHRPKI